MSTIIIYGGTFNPPTEAHVEAVRWGCTHGSEVWVLPAYHHRFKSTSAGAMRQHFDMRMDLCREAFEGYYSKYAGHAYESVVKVLSLELLNPTGAFKDLVALLKSLYPQHEFRYMLGQDAADEVQEGKWVDGLQLVKDNYFVVLSRNSRSEPTPGSWYVPKHSGAFGVNSLYVRNWDGAFLHQVSSTAARECLGNKDLVGAAKQVPVKVMSRIIEKGYYDITT